MVVIHCLRFLLPSFSGKADSSRPSWLNDVIPNLRQLCSERLRFQNGSLATDRSAANRGGISMPSSKARTRSK